MLHEDQVGRLERHGKVALDASELPLDPDRGHELPDPQIPQIELVEDSILMKRSIHVDAVVDTVGPELLEEVGNRA